jgi:hypothetical protein
LAAEVRGDAPHVSVEGQEITNDLLCYKVRCRDASGELPPSLTVRDQFGERVVSRLNTRRVCTPAYKSAGPAYKEPDLQTFVSRQEVTVSAGSPSTVSAQVDLITSVEPEYTITSMRVTSHPPLLPMALFGENLSVRNCPGGTPKLAPQNFGCFQTWKLTIAPDPTICELDGSYSVEVSFGCNPNMPHCDFVDPAWPDETVVLVLDSENFCPVTTTTTSTTTTSTSTTTLAPMCPEDGSPGPCLETTMGLCGPCCADDSTCAVACADAVNQDCLDPTLNTACAAAINAAGCYNDCIEGCTVPPD